MVFPLRRLLSTPEGSGGDLMVHPRVRRALLAAAGLGCGASPAFFGYFDLSIWGPIGLCLVGIAIALLLARQAVPSGIAAVAILGLFAFAAWCLLSMGWAESGDRALAEGDRWIIYGLYLLVLVLLIADRRDAQILLSTSVVGILGIGAYDLARMLGGDGRSLFSGPRLLEPLGYVNGLGGYFLLGFWPLLAVAERVRQPVLAGLAAGAATVLASLVLLTDSRGTAFAFAASAVILLVLLPGRNRRAWAILAVLAGIALAWGPLTDITQALPDPTAAPAADTIRRGAEWSLLMGAGVAVTWGFATWAVDSLAKRSAGARQLRVVSAVLLVGLAFAAVLVTAAAVNDPFGKVSGQYEAFTELEPVKGASRFTSVGGNRYDYWRIAWHQFADHPLDGIGAGNFDRTYFLERRTDEDVRQAHSIELQTLGDTGIVGAILLGSFLVAALIGAWRCAAIVRRREMEVGIVVAATGMFVVWLAQTSVDWLHLIPGVTGIALGAAAILLRCPLSEAGGGTRLRRLRPPALAAAIVVAVGVIVFIGRATMAEHLRYDAESELQSNPRRAFEAADESLSLNPDSLQGYYLKAASLARLHAYQPAKAVLLEAIDHEPHNYVNWALLGDLLTRRGAIPDAMHAYRRAAQLNPRDRGLLMLGTRRRLVEQLHRHPESARSYG
jgi:O-antigen ligase